jgi:hypothetical protein
LEIDGGTLTGRPLGDGADPFGEGAEVGVATCSLPVQ